ncbi:hypothetical protein F4810DRAFT_586605 [Camillea tinctor]|nr:hypothetical protein F4810DRAFT_586605 [Camillea tinctor]
MHSLRGRMTWRHSNASKEDRKVINPGSSLQEVHNPKDAVVDIIAIHGLNPLDKQDHAEATWTSRDKLWLRDFLPLRFRRARIFIYSYNSNVAFQTGTAGVREQAEQVLNQVHTARSSQPDRPLMFICHSLGGIIIKRALVHAKTDSSYRKIWESTFGLVFFGTPHRGGNHAGIGGVASSILRSLSGNPGNTFMEALQPGSLFLNSISDDFRQLLEGFQILSFYETRPLGRLGIIVPKESATLGLAGSREKQLPLDSDHRGICKFDDEQDANYLTVETNIVQMINNAISPTVHNVKRSVPVARQNLLRIDGHSNRSTQFGNGNQSTINGDANEVCQFGAGNESTICGQDNMSTQIVPEMLFASNIQGMMALWGVQFIIIIRALFGLKPLTAGTM